MNDEMPQKGEGWLEYFYRKNKVAEVILLGWSITEFDLNQLVTKQFKLFYDDKKAKILTDMTFNRKLEFLKEQQVLNTSQYKRVKEFQEMRNKLYHGKQKFWFTQPFVEQQKMMRIAKAGSDALREVMFGKKK